MTGRARSAARGCAGRDERLDPLRHRTAERRRARDRPRARARSRSPAAYRARPSAAGAAGIGVRDGCRPLREAPRAPRGDPDRGRAASAAARRDRRWRDVATRRSGRRSRSGSRLPCHGGSTGSGTSRSRTTATRNASAATEATPGRSCETLAERDPFVLAAALARGGDRGGRRLAPAPWRAGAAGTGRARSTGARRCGCSPRGSLAQAAFLVAEPAMWRPHVSQIVAPLGAPVRAPARAVARPRGPRRARAPGVGRERARPILWPEPLLPQRGCGGPPARGAPGGRVGDQRRSRLRVARRAPRARATSSTSR